MDNIDACDTEKYALVMKWLKDIFGDEPIPYFHISHDFIEHLYALMMQECRLVKSSQSYDDFVSTSIEDYSEDLSSKLRILNVLGLSDAVKSPSTEATNLAAISHQLSLANSDDPSYILALTDLDLEKHKITSKHELLIHSINQGSDDLAAAIKLNSQLEQLMTKLTQQPLTEKSLVQLSQDAEFLLSKAAKYRSDQKKQEVELSKSGVTDSLTHERLVADHETLQRLVSKLDGTREELDKFANLPPDKDLARVKLEVARIDLQEIENKLAKEIDMFHV